MTELHPEVDTETLVVQYLADTEFTDDDDPGVSGKLPPGWTPAQQWIRVTAFGSTDADRGVGHVVAQRVDVEAFGPDALPLHRIAARALRALRLLPTSSSTFPGAVVTDVAKGIGIENRPDEDSDAERYRFDVVVTLHPVDTPPGEL